MFRMGFPMAFRWSSRLGSDPTGLYRSLWILLKMPWLIGEFWGLFLAQLLGVIYRPISIMGWDRLPRLIFHGSCMDQNHPKPWYMQFISKWLVQMDWMFVLRAINAISYHSGPSHSIQHRVLSKNRHVDPSLNRYWPSPKWVWNDWNVDVSVLIRQMIISYHWKSKSGIPFLREKNI
jgi:hypothetical protein